MFLTLADTGGEASATPSPHSHQFAREPSHESLETLQLYVDNKDSIDAVWIAMDERDPERGATLSEAVHEWLVSRDVGSQVADAAESEAEAESQPELDELFTQPAEEHEHPQSELASLKSAIPESVCRSGSCGQSSGRRFGWRIRSLFGRR